jgi:hypothetical protein
MDGLRRQHALRGEDHSSQPFGMAGEHAHDREHGNRGRGGDRSTQLDGVVEPGIHRLHAGIEEEHERREHDQHRCEIQHALDQNRREDRREAEPLAAGQQIWTHRFARSRGKKCADRESDDGGPERDAEPGPPNRPQQELPAHRSHDVHEHHREDGTDDRSQLRPPQLDPDRGEVGASQEVREKRDGHGEDQTRTELGTHEDSVI